MELGWGKLKHWLIPLEKGVPNKAKAIAIYTPAEDTYNLEPNKGDKKEATIEGGEVEAVKYSKNKPQVTFELRQGNEDGTPRKKPVVDHDGVVEGEYQYMMQPENPEVEGFTIDRCVVSCEDTFNAADGARWKYTIDAMKPSEGDTVKWGIVTDPTAAA